MTVSNANPLLKNKVLRNSSIELCRILSMLMIVACHFATHGDFNFDKTSITIPRLWWHFIEMGGNFGVDVFILISGYFLINDTKLTINLRKCLKLWGQIFIYSICIYIFGLLTGIIKFSSIQLAKALFPITTGAWWFSTTYFVLFLIHPYLNMLLNNLEKRQYQNYLALLLLIWCIIPTFTTYSLASNPLLEFVLFYSIAGYIRLYGFGKKLKSKHFLYLWLLTTALTFLSSIVLMVIGRRVSLFSEHTLLFYGRRSLPTLLRAVFFFMIFERMTIPHNKYINLISSTAFGVYLIHDSKIIRPWLWKTVFVNNQYQASLIIIPYSLVVVIVVYIVCSIIDLIRSHTVEPLFMRIVNGRADKLLQPLKAIMKHLR